MVDDHPRVRDVDAVGSRGAHVDDDSANRPPAEADRHDIAADDLVRDAIREHARKRARRDEGKHLGEGHRGERIRGTGDDHATISRRAEAV